MKYCNQNVEHEHTDHSASNRLNLVSCHVLCLVFVYPSSFHRLRMDTERMFEFFAMGNEHLRTLTLASAVLDAIRLACVRVISLPF